MGKKNETPKLQTTQGNPRSSDLTEKGTLQLKAQINLNYKKYSKGTW